MVNHTSVKCYKKTRYWFDLLFWLAFIKEDFLIFCVNVKKKILLIVAVKISVFFKLRFMA